MALTEIQRQEYLEIMGVQSYFPRYQLPGARVSVLAESSSEQVESAVEAVSEAIANVGLKSPEPPLNTLQSIQTIQEPKEKDLNAELRIQELGNILENAPETEVNSQSSLEPQASDVSPGAIKSVNEAATDSDVRFRLSVFRVSENICVLNQVPHVGLSQMLSPQHRALFTNICQSLNLTQTPVEFDLIEPFNWPFEVQANLDNGAAAAQSGIRAYLEQQHSVQAFDTLIVMGEMMSRYCSASIVNSSPDKAKGLWKTINTPSLDEMLKAWQFKRDAWRGLRSLKSLH